jgi:hypothetical protein
VALQDQLFAKLDGFQKTILGQFFDLFGIVYYIGGVFVAFVLTSTESTCRIRLYLFLGNFHILLLHSLFGPAVTLRYCE